jgi:hypothetical protein
MAPQPIFIAATAKFTRYQLYVHGPRKCMVSGPLKANQYVLPWAIWNYPDFLPLPLTTFPRIPPYRYIGLPKTPGFCPIHAKNASKIAKNRIFCPTVSQYIVPAERHNWNNVNNYLLFLSLLVPLWARIRIITIKFFAVPRLTIHVLYGGFNVVNMPCKFVKVVSVGDGYLEVFGLHDSPGFILQSAKKWVGSN